MVNLQTAAKDVVNVWDALTTDNLERIEPYIEALRQALEEPPNYTTDVVEPVGEIVEAHGLIAVSIPKMPPVGTKLYVDANDMSGKRDDILSKNRHIGDPK